MCLSQQTRLTRCRCDMCCKNVCHAALARATLSVSLLIGQCNQPYTSSFNFLFRKAERELPVVRYPESDADRFCYQARFYTFSSIRPIFRHHFATGGRSVERLQFESNDFESQRRTWLMELKPSCKSVSPGTMLGVNNVGLFHSSLPSQPTQPLHLPSTSPNQPTSGGSPEEE